MNEVLWTVKEKKNQPLFNLTRQFIDHASNNNAKLLQNTLSCLQWHHLRTYYAWQVSPNNICPCPLAFLYSYY